jgi:MFS family permease
MSVTASIEQDTKNNDLLNEGAANSSLSEDDHRLPDLEHITTETRPWYKVPHFIRLNFAIFLITLTSTNNGFDGSLLNGLQSLEHWSPAMGYPTGQTLGALSNGTIFGCILSFPVAPWLSDRYGRVKTMFIGQFLTIVGAVLQGASTNYAFFLVSRIVLGTGVGIAAVASPTLISEMAFTTHRPVATTAFNLCWYLGATFAAIVTYLTRVIDSNASWKIPSYLQAFFPVVQLSLIWLIPESPRYLIAKGKVDKAEEFMKKYHIGGSTHQKDLDFVQFEIREIEAAL